MITKQQSRLIRQAATKHLDADQWRTALEAWMEMPTLRSSGIGGSALLKYFLEGSTRTPGRYLIKP